jgi:hypothetical protein
MASTYSSDLKLELQATGENAGTWGTKTNNNLELVQQAIAGYEEIDVASSDVALSMSDGAISNARNMVLKFTGTLGANRTVTVEDGIEKFYLVVDGTTHDGNSLTFKTVSGTGFDLDEGKSFFCYSDGTNINPVAGSQIGGLTLDNVLDNGNSSDGTINVSNITVTASTTVNTISASSTIDAVGDITTDAELNDSKGEIREVPLSSKTTDYTLIASDHGKIISISAGDITVPPSVFSAGQTVSIYADGATIDINRGSGVTMYWAQTGDNANRDLASRGIATIVCVASNTFVITGGTLS